MSDETELAFVARLRDEASRQARELRSTLDQLAGTTKAVTVPIEARNEASAAIVSVQEELGKIGPTAQVAAREAKAASAEIGRTFVDSAGRIRNADGTFAKAGTAAGTATVEGFRKTSEKGAAESGRRFGSIFTKSTLGPLRAYGEAAAGFFALDKLQEFVRESVSDAREVQKAQRLTAQAIKTTGGAAGITAEEVGKLSEHLAASTGIDEAQIQTGARLMLTFRQVRNELGKGNDVYTRAVELGNDVAVSMGESQQSAAIQLGKALNDPIRGLAMLNRVGIQFDAQQTDRIKKLVKEGNLLGAQKIILGEVAKEFGGSARAAATSGGRLRESFRELRVELGTALFGAIGKVENRLSGDLIPALHALPGEIKAGIGYLQTFGRDVEPGLLDIWHALRADIIPALHDVIVLVKPLAGISLAGLVVGFRLAAAAVNDLAPGLKAVTGFLVENRTAAAALAGLIAALLVPSLVAMLGQLVRIVALNVGAALYVIRGAALAAAEAFAIAGGGVKGLTAALATLELNPIILALTAFAAIAGGIWMHFHSGEERARHDIDDFVASLNTSKSSLASLQTQASALTAHMSELAAEGKLGFGQIMESMNQLAATRGEIATAQANIAALGKTYGLTADEVQGLAEANSLDLTGSYDALNPQIGKALALLAQTHNPTAQAAADIKSLGNKAHSAADDVQLLTNALALFAGNSLSADQASIAFRNDVDALDKALKKSHGSMRLSKPAARAARSAFDDAAQGAIDAAGAQAKLKNGTERARSTLTAEIKTLRSHAGNSDYAKAALGRLQAALDHFPGVASKAASGVESSGKRMSAAARQSAAAAIAAVRHARGEASKAGQEFSGGFVQGILATIVDANAAAIRLVTSAAAAARSRKGQHSGSPSRKTRRIGGEWGDGWIVGALSRVPQVKAAALKIVNAATSAFASERSTLRDSVNGLTAEIMTGFRETPAKLDKSLAAIRKTIRHDVDAMRRTLGSTSRTLGNRAATLRGEIARTKDAASRRRYVAELAKIERQRSAVIATRRAIGKEEDAALATLRKRTDRLDALARRRATVAARLAKAESGLAAVRQAKADLESTIRGGISSFTDVTGTGPDNGAPVTVGFIAQGLAQRLAAVKRWAGDIRRLIRRHVNRGIIQQIIAAGPDAGEAYAHALALATDAQIGDVNSTERKIDKSSKSLADYAGYSMYDAGIKAAKGLVDGLRKREKDLDDAARALGRRIAKAIKHELGIKSPSRRLRDEVGAMVPAGTAEGIAAHSYLAEAAAAKMAARVAKASAVELGTAGGATLPGVTITRAASSTVEIRHRVTFDQPEVAAKLDAQQVADVIARDPRSAERLERALAPTRGRIRAGVHTASK